MPAENWPSAETAASAAPRGAPGPADYDAIFAAVMETERGRWFLAEYARRNRHADTAEVLAALERVAARQALAGPQPGQRPAAEAGADLDRLRAELADMANAIARTKTEIASIRPDAAQGGRIMEATEQLDSVLRTTERATSDILAAAEQVQEVAWTMREQGMESEFCDRLDRYATEIYTACSFQDVTGQRTRKIIHVLRYLEARIQAMSGIWGTATQGALQATPEQAARSDDLVQNDVDRVMAPPVPALAAGPAVDAAAAAPAGDVCDRTEPAVDAPAPPDDGAATATPTAAAESPADEAKSTLTIEGPAGSFSIVAGRAAEPEQAQSAAAPDAPPPPVEPASVVADLRAFAANLVAEYRKEPAAPPNASPAVVTTPTAVADITPAVEPSPAPLSAPAPVAIEEPPVRHGEIVLPLTAAPQLGDLPQRPEPAPAPRRKVDIAENLFVDVMALTEEERIALFT
jgi:chemotaxis protein CheZ